jgi:hypothetical protein
MSAVDTILKMFTKETKDPDAPKPPVGSRSEREAKLKDKAGMVISIFALLLAVNAWYGGKLSSTVLNNTLGANNTWAQYQAKAGRGVSYEIAAKTTADPKIYVQSLWLKKNAWMLTRKKLLLRQEKWKPHVKKLKSLAHGSVTHQQHIN